MNEQLFRMAIAGAQRTEAGNWITRRWGTRDLDAAAFAIAEEEFGFDAIVYDFAGNMPAAARAAIVAAVHDHSPAPRPNTTEWYRWSQDVSVDALARIRDALHSSL